MKDDDLTVGGCVWGCLNIVFAALIMVAIVTAILYFGKLENRVQTLERQMTEDVEAAPSGGEEAEASVPSI